MLFDPNLIFLGALMKQRSKYEMIIIKSFWPTLVFFMSTILLTLNLLSAVSSLSLQISCNNSDPNGFSSKFNSDGLYCYKILIVGLGALCVQILSFVGILFVFVQTVLAQSILLGINPRVSDAISGENSET